MTTEENKMIITAKTAQEVLDAVKANDESEAIKEELFRGRGPDALANAEKEFEAMSPLQKAEATIDMFKAMIDKALDLMDEDNNKAAYNTLCLSTGKLVQRGKP